MTSDFEKTNTFLIWMAKLTSRSKLLLSKSKDAPLTEVSADYRRLESIWENYIEHANRFEINLQDYAGQVNQIISNFDETQEIIEKRSRNSFVEKIIEPSLRIAKTVDDFLIGWGFRRQPLLVPIVNIFLELLKWGKFIAPPPPTPYLPPPMSNGVEVCRHCFGSRTEKCPVCDGTGNSVNLGFYKEPCSTCNGTGKTDCLHCAV